MNSNPDSTPLVMLTDTPQRFAAAVARAAALLRAGQVVALPTETVYGLAANAFDACAVARIYEAKGRPAHNPIIVHVNGLPMAQRCAQHWPPVAERLAGAFWPGPLTLVLPRASDIPDIVTAGGPTVGVRWPRHPLFEAVIAACGFPLAAPSANPSNSLSPTTAAHVAAHLGHRIPLIVDGGSTEVGIESTVVDITTERPRVLRPGVISEAELRACIPQLAAPLGDPPPETIITALRSPGLLRKHYAPRTRMVLWRWNNEEELRARVGELSLAPARIRIVAYACVPQLSDWLAVHRLPADPKNCARLLYTTLHLADQPGADLIVVEQPPHDEAWKAVADRLRRAAAVEVPAAPSPNPSGIS
jgi:L-threonylcarbamoyladenylate synthase